MVSIIVSRDLEVEWNDDKVQALLGQAPERIRAPLRKALVDAGHEFVADMLKRRFGGYRGKAYQYKLQVRTGALRNSIGSVVVDELGGSFALVAFANTPYAAMQEFGGTIKPKKGKYLAIPIGDTLTPSGVVKGSALLRRSGGHHVTGDGRRTFIFRSKAGNLLVGAKPKSKARAKRGEIDLLRVLKESVTIPGPATGARSRFGFIRTWDQLATSRARRFSKALAEALG